MQWVSMLNWWQWLILGIVPPAIVALYFLKLKRVPLEVPSTYLWRKSIEDLHVNSLWQKLRKNLLLWLQLLLLALIMLALWNPSFEGSKLSGQRFIFAVDNSASMSATDGEAAEGAGESGTATRLDEAKHRVARMIDAMETGDAAMIVSFADNANVKQEFTTSKSKLREQLDTIGSTARRTSIVNALRLAAGLANPAQTAEDPGDTAAAKALPAQLVVLSDFKFPDVADFSLGNLEPRFEMVGDRKSENVGIVTFTTRRHEQKVNQIQAFARIENKTDKEVTVAVELFLDGQSIDVKESKIKAGGFQQVVFTINDVETGVLKITHDYEDALEVDNEAWAVVNPPRQSRVLFVSTGNIAWERWFGTDKAKELVSVDIASPAESENAKYKQRTETGYYELVIYDNVQPKTMPQSNTLLMGAMPPGDRWKKGKDIFFPQIIDTERTHPIMQLLELGDVDIEQSFEVTPPSGGSTLIESDEGTIFAIGPREGFEDAVLGFALEDTNENGDRVYMTTWPLKRSFPVFVQEVITYLGTRQQDVTGSSVPPGQPYVVYDPMGPSELTFRSPDGTAANIRQDDRRRYTFSRTDRPGIYQIRDKQNVVRRFAVNLFDSLESDIQPVSGAAIKRIGNVDVDVADKPDWEVARQELWKLLALLGLGVLVLEWYIYNRRVYV
jgi:hypothetical protein